MLWDCIRPFQSMRWTPILIRAMCAFDSENSGEDGQQEGARGPGSAAQPWNLANHVCKIL